MRESVDRDCRLEQVGTPSPAVRPRPPGNAYDLAPSGAELAAPARKVPIGVAVPPSGLDVLSGDLRGFGHDRAGKPVPLCVKGGSAGVFGASGEAGC